MEIKIPDEFEILMRETFGRDEADALIKALNEPPGPGAVRLNPLKPCELPYWFKDASPVEWSPNGFRLSPALQRPNFTMSPQLHGGALYVQEPASMVIEEIIASITTPGKPVKMLDMCAAPGGKTTAALTQLPPGSLMVAHEFDGQRAQILKENVEKWGYPNVVVTQGSLDWIKDASSMFDVILADVPCSGEGMMRKDAEARRQWSPSLVRRCSALQRSIAAIGVNALRPGGYFIYSTCTFNNHENENNTDWLCSTYNLERVMQRRFMPHKTNSEGLYVCVMRKSANVYDSFASREPYIHRRRAPKLLEVPWILNDDTYGPMEIRVNNNVGRLLGSSHWDTADWIGQRAHVLMAGTEVADVKVKGVVPTHAAVMSVFLNRLMFPSVELNQIQAVRFLARELPSIPLPPEKGYVVITHQGLPIGMVKNLGNRYNSLYPQNYRIRNLGNI